MARIRTIKPEFPQSESMGRVSREARLLFVLLWTICDDAGRTRASSRMLASLLYPYDEDAASLIDGWLGELELESCIIRYEVDGSHYLQVKKWNDHQKIDKPTKSRVPPCDESSRILANSRGELSSPRESSCEDQRKGSKDQGSKEQEGSIPPFDPNGDLKTTIPDTPPKRGPLEPKESKKTPTNVHGERWTDEQGKKFEELMIDIKAKLKPYPAQQVYKFTQTYYNRANPEAMNRCLGSIHNAIMKGEVIAKPFEWLVAALMGTKDGKAGENQKCEAAESERIHEVLKADEARDVARMIGGIGRAIQ